MEKDFQMPLFTFFHLVKNFTTKSYSMKKLQDLIEARLDKNTPVKEEEFQQFVDHFQDVVDEVNLALEKLKQEYGRKQS